MGCVSIPPCVTSVRGRVRALLIAARRAACRLAKLEEEERKAGLSLAGQMFALSGFFLLTIVSLHLLIALLPEIAHAVRRASPNTCLSRD